MGPFTIIFAVIIFFFITILTARLLGGALIFAKESSPHGKLPIAPYSEVTLFLIASTFLLFMLFDPEVRGMALGIFPEDADFNSILVFGALIFPFAAGFLASLYYALTPRPASRRMRVHMLRFVIILNLVISITALDSFFGSLKNSSASVAELIISLIFPLVNLMYSVFLAIALQVNMIGAQNVSTKDAKPYEILTGFAAAALIFVCGKIFFNLHWTVLFSVVLTYAFLVHRAVAGLFFKKSKNRLP